MCKFICLFLVLMILYLIQNKCEKEGFFSMMYKPKQCKDDPKWFVENNDGKHYCGHIGKSVSCYDRDAIGREGWEKCLKSCGNCANTKVSKVPMGILAGFSGDPYEDFGVVLHKSEDRQWVGKTASEDDKDDIRGYVMGKEQGEAIDELDEKVSSMEDIFDIITGNVKKCGKDVGDKCKIGVKDGYKGCDNDVCLPCNSKKGKDDKDDKHSYIKQEDGNILFPPVEISCNSISKILGDNKTNKIDKPFKYIGCYKSVKKDFKFIDKEIKCITGPLKTDHCIQLDKTLSPLKKIQTCANVCKGKISDSIGLKTEIPIEECCRDKVEVDYSNKSVPSSRKDGEVDVYLQASAGPLHDVYAKGHLELKPCINTTKGKNWFPPFQLIREKNGMNYLKALGKHTVDKHGVSYPRHPDCDPNTPSPNCYKDDPTDKPWHKYFTKEGRKYIENNYTITGDAEKLFKDDPDPKKAGQSNSITDRELANLPDISGTTLNIFRFLAKEVGKCYIDKRFLPQNYKQGEGTMMGLEYGNQCYCGSGSSLNNGKNSVEEWNCGIDGSRSVSKNPAPNISSVYMLKLLGSSLTDNIFDLKYDPKKTDQFDNSTKNIPISTKCNQYYLFDKIKDKSNKEGKKEKDKRITLGDMCPKQCHKKVCN